MDNIEKLNGILRSFKIKAACVDFTEYSNAYFYDLVLNPGARVRDVQKFSTEIALALKAVNKPRISVMSEQGVVRFEFLKSSRNKIPLLELGNQSPRPTGALTCLMGETLEGQPVWIDLVKNPHMIVAGCTGSGKSTILHTLIANLLLHRNVKLFLMDPKNIEFYKYDENKIKQIKVSYSYQDCLNTLEIIETEMNRRYLQIKENKVDVSVFPYITLIIDEFADLIMQDYDQTFFKKLCIVAQKSRAARIHIILATQRPSVNIVNGAIKANFPARLACKVSSGVDSRVILDQSGAENLVGNGDSIINNVEHTYQRFQAAYTYADEVCKYFK